ncbi:AMP-binding protein [Mycolicibacterium neworleansense]|uniref:AMP-binding protein n=1 Tax=Mycolicibacterium neworleansense TaxID=146018 RepID=UPI000B803C69|nr:AMP-binding protein [Mycolicibacterium neworleansense]MCV7360102.1 AMP-binding protein [Mycolicibacterium neworleansense]
MARDVIAIDTTLDHPCPDIWAILETPDLYPRFFRGLGSCERATSDPQLFEVRLSTSRGAVVVHEMRRTVRLSGMELRLDATQTGRCFASIRLTPEGSGARIALRIFAVGTLHPDIAKAGDNAVEGWIRDGLRRISDYLAGEPSAQLVNMGDGRSLQLNVLKTMITSGVVRASRPDRGIRQLNSLAKWGFTLAGGLTAAAARAPRTTATIDEYGTSTYAEMAERTTRLASGLAVIGFTSDSTLAVLARNHSAMVECMVAASKLGADLVLLNTGLAARAIEEIVKRHRVDAIFVDSGFEPEVRYVAADTPRISIHPNSATPQRRSVEELIATGTGATPVAPPKQPGKLVALTSGTTGTPKGARRPTPPGFGAIAAMLSRMPLHRGEVMLLSAPLFHTWGLAALQVSTPLLATVVLMERFDAEACLKAIERHRCTVVVLVPVMLQRILELPAAVVKRYDTSSLKVVASSGSPIPGAAVTKFMDTFGDVLYNFYGSTEVSWATIADPADLRVAPTTAGRPPLGTRIAILDEGGRVVPVGVVGRIFVGNDMLFDGYTNAASPAVEDRLMDTGDLGYLDASGRLFVAGRDDDMIISGGENVFPRPVEEAIAVLPQVADVAVVGVPDSEFGQRLAAFVVRAEGTSLDEDTVKNYVRNRLSRFSIPRDVTFVDQLPRTATGKVLKRHLIEGHFGLEMGWPGQG